MKKLIFTALFFLLPVIMPAQTANEPFIRGVDLSFTPQIEDLGGKYKLNGIEKDALDIFKENGVNYVRLRIWNNPAAGYCGLAKTIPYAKRIKAKGLKLLLDFHYSDWWADPGKQIKPALWEKLTFDALKDSVYAYTYYVITSLKNQGALPDMVQVGNEITGGMLWPDGKVGGTQYNTDPQWINFTNLLKAGVLAVKDAASGADVKIMIHIDRGGDNGGSRWFYDKITALGVPFDIIGLSYYPWWHGSLTAVRDNMNDLAVRYNKPVVIAETAYPWTSQYLNDGMGNVGYDPAKLPAGYPVSVKGQKDFLIYLVKLIKETKNGKGAGFFYWEPAYISVPPIGSSWEQYTVFDFKGEAFNSLIAFQDLDSLKSVNVKVRINTATLGDTIKTSSFIQIRGEVQGISSSLLPSGEQVKWDAGSQLIMKNTGGDYWEYQFKMYPADLLLFKLWAGHDKNTPIYRNLGWEGPVTPYDGSAQAYRLFTAGMKDTTLDIEYFNSTGDNAAQYYTPLKPKKDSTGLLFRVNLLELMKNNVFDPASMYVTIRGDSASSAGILSWFSDKIKLNREEMSLGGGSFFSAPVYFPKSKVKEGTQLKYKFYVVNSKFGGWESGISDRTISLPAADSTLMWKFFNDRKIITGVNSEKVLSPGKHELYQNYPNPFNPSTSIDFYLPSPRKVTLKVYDILGNEAAVLVNGYMNAGYHSASFSAGYLPSGTYFYQLSASGTVLTRKMTLIK